MYTYTYICIYVYMYIWLRSLGALGQTVTQAEGSTPPGDGYRVSFMKGVRAQEVLRRRTSEEVAHRVGERRLPQRASRKLGRPQPQTPAEDGAEAAVRRTAASCDVDVVRRVPPEKGVEGGVARLAAGGERGAHVPAIRHQPLKMSQ